VTAGIIEPLTKQGHTVDYYLFLSSSPSLPESRTYGKYTKDPFLRDEISDAKIHITKEVSIAGARSFFSKFISRDVPLNAFAQLKETVLMHELKFKPYDIVISQQEDAIWLKGFSFIHELGSIIGDMPRGILVTCDSNDTTLQAVKSNQLNWRSAPVMILNRVAYDALALGDASKYRSIVVNKTPLKQVAVERMAFVTGGGKTFSCLKGWCEGMEYEYSATNEYPKCLYITLPMQLDGLSCPAARRQEMPNTCAHQWQSFNNRYKMGKLPAPRVFLLVMFRDTKGIDILRFLQYHLLQGVTDIVAVDNSCDSQQEGTRKMLREYEGLKILTLVDMRCINLTHYIERNLSIQNTPENRDKKGASGIVKEMLVQGQVDVDIPNSSLIVALDDDEYVVGLPSPDGFRVLQEYMTKHNECYFRIKWLNFGTSKYKCQPDGPIITKFKTRVDDKLEYNSEILSEQLLNHRNPLVLKKPVYLWNHGVRCYTHDCESVFETSCQPMNPVNSSFRRIRINHYYAQSMENWLQKSRRGRTSGAPAAIGSVPEFYDMRQDIRTIKELQTFLRPMREKDPKLFACIDKLFAEGRSILSLSLSGR